MKLVSRVIFLTGNFFMSHSRRLNSPGSVSRGIFCLLAKHKIAATFGMFAIGS